MQVRIMLQIVGDEGTIGTTEEVADLTKVTEGAEDLGLSLAESKALLAAAQQRIVEAQVNGWLENHRHCKITGRKLRRRAATRLPSGPCSAMSASRAHASTFPKSGRPTGQRRSRH
jgi:hypothetical protein